MIISANPARTGTYIESQLGMLHPQSQLRRHLPPAVTISRQTGTRGAIVGRQLVSFLNSQQPDASPTWRLFEKDLVEKVLEDHHMPARLEKFMPEDRVSEVQSTIEEIIGLHPSTWDLVQKTTETITDLVEVGNVVIYGRGSNLIAAGMKNVVNVRLVGSAAVRVRQTARQLQITQDEARTTVKIEDGGRRRYVKSHFGKDIDEPTLYDLVINKDRLTDMTVVRMIVDLALRRRRIGR